MTVGTIKIWSEYGNEKWAGVMNNGQGDQPVTGTVDLPQGGTKKSEAAVLGGINGEADEPATGIFDEINTQTESLAQGLVGDAISEGDLSGAAARIVEIEVFLTNFGKSRLMVYLGECENADEIEATNQVIDSYKVHVECNIDFSIVEEELKNKIASAIGGGS